MEAEANAVGIPRINTNGYVEYTVGPNKETAPSKQSARQSMSGWIEKNFFGSTTA